MRLRFGFGVWLGFLVAYLPCLMLVAAIREMVR